jgi:hypothetical protein
LTLSAIPAEVIGHPWKSITLSVPKVLRRSRCA